jgi:hypothetical protein
MDEKRPLAWNAGDGPALTSLTLVRSRGRVPRAELGRRIQVLDPNLAQSLRAFIISKPKFEHVASTGELHIAVGIQAKTCNEGASAEVRFCPLHGRSPYPVSGSATETLTPLPDLLTATTAPPFGRGRELEDPSPTDRPRAALLQFPINQPLTAGDS